MMYFSENHVWMVPIHDHVVKVGLSAIMKDNLGEIMYVELPSLEKVVHNGDLLVLLESSKAAIEVLSPLEGSVMQVNDALRENLSLINNSPEDEGWFAIIKLTRPFNSQAFLSREEYSSSE